MDLKIQERSFKTFDEATAFIDELCVTSGGVSVFQWPNSSDWTVRWYHEARVITEEKAPSTKKGWKSRFFQWLTSL